MKDESEIIRLTRPVGGSDHVLGPQSGPATLIEYGDYKCPYCRQLHPIIQEIMRRTEGLRFVSLQLNIDATRIDDSAARQHKVSDHQARIRTQTHTQAEHELDDQMRGQRP
jgi:protein-disulfide isomerase